MTGPAEQVLSAALGLANVTATILISRRMRAGWILYAAPQCAWCRTTSALASLAC